MSIRFLHNIGVQKSLLAVFFICIILIVYFHFTVDTRKGHWSVSQSINTPCNENFQADLSKYRRCLQERTLNVSIWITLNEAVHNCMDNDLWKRLDVQTLKNGDGDLKFVVLPGQNAIQCTEVTLGVGGDIKAEQELLKLLPQCKLYGADPILESGKPFSQVGEYFQMAVSSESGVMTASVLENGRYLNKQVETMDFMSFIQNHAKIDHIDHLWMDNEGAEFKIIPKYLVQPSITICQWSVEMHGPFEQYDTSRTEFDEMMSSILEISPFLPIWSIGGGHYRLFFINVQDPYCLETYFLPNFCGDK